MTAVGADRRIRLGAVGDDPRHVGVGLDVVDVGGLAPQAGDRREGRPLARHAALALDARDERRLLAADEGAGALLDLDGEVPAAAEQVGPKKASFLRGGDGDAETLHGERVLGPHVDVPLMRTDGVGGDEHALKDRMGIAVHDRRVHEGAGIALVAVADDVLHIARRLARKVPFRARGKARATATAQAGVKHLLDDLLGAHAGEGLARGLVTAARQVLVEALRVDGAHVAQRDPRLLGVEGDVVGTGDTLAARRVDVEQILHDLAPGEVLLDDARNILELEARIVRVAARHDGEWPLGTEAVAAADGHLHGIGEAGFRHLVAERLMHLERACEHAGCAGAHRDPHATVARRRHAHLDAGGGAGGVRHRAHRPQAPNSPHPASS